MTVKPIVRIGVGIAVILGGSLITTGAKSVIDSKADKYTVDSLKIAQHDQNAMIIRELQGLHSAIDSTNLRISQIKCGPHLANGCR